MSEIIKNADMLAAEINGIKEQVKEKVLSGAMEIGWRLIEAKKLVPYGEWGNWLKEKVNYSERTAQNMMQLAGEYRDAEEMLNLPYTKALALLGLPREEREEFAKEHDIENESTRQLQEEIKALKAEKEKMQVKMDDLLSGLSEEQTESEETQALSELVEELTEKLQAARDEAVKAQTEMEDEISRYKAAMETAQKAAAKAQGEATKAKEQAEDRQKRFEAISQSLNESEKKHAEEKAALEKAVQEAGKPVIQQVTPPEVEKELEALRAQAGRGQAESEARVHYDTMKTVFAKMEAALNAMDGETAAKYRGAFAKSLRLMAEKMEGKA